MIPYGTFQFFLITAILLAPTIILGLMGKKFQAVNMIVSVLFLVLIFSKDTTESLALIMFTIWQILLIKGYIAYRNKANSGFVFCTAIILSILPLLATKLSPYLFEDNLFGFLGISYLTFKSVQMIMETRDGLIKGKMPIVQLLYFILFFPTISSGPIDRYRRFAKDVNAVLTKEQYKLYLYDGVNKIFLGFLYKYIIGYCIYHYVIADISLTANSSFLDHLYYMYAYSFYLFFDFAGYSAFAIGVSYMMGIKSPENFNKPFISRNIKDFWNRWHLSLSFWFRDYVFMRFVFWMTKKKWIRNKMLLNNLGYILLFLLMGVWHGFEVQYIVYGSYHAALMVLYNLFEKYNKQHKWVPKNKFTHAASVVITFHFICFGFYIFSGQLIHS